MDGYFIPKRQIPRTSGGKLRPWSTAGRCRAAGWGKGTGRRRWCGGASTRKQQTHNQNSYLLESTLNFWQRNYGYTRLELVDKDELFPELQAHPSYRIGAYTFGGVRDFVHNHHWQLGLGADVTFYSKPVTLDPMYGNNPVSFHVFLRVRPGLMDH